MNHTLIHLIRTCRAYHEAVDRAENEDEITDAFEDMIEAVHLADYPDEPGCPVCEERMQNGNAGGHTGDHD